MVRETISQEHLMIGQPVGINVLKYCAEHGMEKGFTPIAPMTMIVNGTTVTYKVAMGIKVEKDTKIELVQE